jgi:hypothetical protein
MIARPLAAWAAARASSVEQQSAVYRYRVEHPGAGPTLGATHTTEVPLIFGTWNDGGPGERLGGQAASAGVPAEATDAVAAELVEAWGRFIHDGDPGWSPLDPSPSLPAPPNPSATHSPLAPDPSTSRTGDAAAPEIRTFGSRPPCIRSTNR